LGKYWKDGGEWVKGSFMMECPNCDNPVLSPGRVLPGGEVYYCESCGYEKKVMAQGLKTVARIGLEVVKFALGHHPTN
jgi:hypothetical protein